SQWFIGVGVPLVGVPFDAGPFRLCDCVSPVVVCSAFAGGGGGEDAWLDTGGGMGGVATGGGSGLLRPAASSGRGTDPTLGGRAGGFGWVRRSSSASWGAWTGAALIIGTAAGVGAAAWAAGTLVGRDMRGIGWGGGGAEGGAPAGSVISRLPVSVCSRLEPA